MSSEEHFIPTFAWPPRWLFRNHRPVNPVIKDMAAEIRDRCALVTFRDGRFGVSQSTKVRFISESFWQLLQSIFAILGFT
jgi:hypothetical protein